MLEMALVAPFLLKDSQCFQILAAVLTSGSGGCNIGLNAEASHVEGGEGVGSKGGRTSEVGDIDATEVVLA